MIRRSLLSYHIYYSTNISSLPFYARAIIFRLCDLFYNKTGLRLDKQLFILRQGSLSLTLSSRTSFPDISVLSMLSTKFNHYIILASFIHYHCTYTYIFKYLVTNEMLTSIKIRTNEQDNIDTLSTIFITWEMLVYRNPTNDRQSKLWTCNSLYIHVLL